LTASARTYVKTDVNEVMKMKESIAKESPHRRIARRVGAAGVAVATTLVLAGCHEAQGGGYIGAPLPNTTNPVFNGKADFGFNFQCDAGVKGQITYHDSSTKVSVGGVLFSGLRLHGTVDKVLIDDDLDLDTPAVPADTCEEIVESRWAQFQGSYRSQEKKLLSAAPGRFTVLVFDQGEPGRTKDPQITGDGFSIDLKGGPYPLYTRAGYIEGGNIQVDK
jgi:hypothetical protein